MIRKLILPVLAAALLGGCVTGYSYRQGSGDYYYGAPSVEYRYYPAYSYGAYGYYGPYRYGHPYGYGFYGYGFGGYYPYRSHGGYGYGYPYHYRRPGRPGYRVDHTPDGDTSPWRRLDEPGRRGRGDDPAPPPTVSNPPPQPPPQVRPTPRRGSMEGRLQRARERAPDPEEAR